MSDLGTRVVRSFSIYIDSEKLASATESSLEHNSNITVVNTDQGRVVQLGREDGQFTANFVIPSGSTGYTRLRNKQKDQGITGIPIEVQIGVVGDAMHSAQCIIQTLGASATVADGSATANVTLQMLTEGEVHAFEISL